MVPNKALFHFLTQSTVLDRAEYFYRRMPGLQSFNSMLYCHMRTFPTNLATTQISVVHIYHLVRIKQISHHLNHSCFHRFELWIFLHQTDLKPRKVLQMVIVWFNFSCLNEKDLWLKSVWCSVILMKSCKKSDSVWWINLSLIVNNWAVRGALISKPSVEVL